MKQAFLFPGQGSQHVGMGKELFDTFQKYREVVEFAEDVLSMHLKKLMFEGPIETLTDTENTQPSLLTMSFGIFSVLKENAKTVRCDYAAGHSLGEYTALTCFGGLSFEDALKITRFRGEAMKKASEGSMAAIIGLDYETLKNCLVEEGCVIANDNCPGQLVISGLAEAVEQVMENAKKAGAKIIKKLAVSGPFHSPWMKEAADELEKFLESIKVHPLLCPYYPNLTAEPTKDHKSVKASLVKQITHPVRFRETLIHMIEHNKVEKFYEIGPSKVLQGLVKRTNSEVKTLSISTPHDIEEYIKQNETEFMPYDFSLQGKSALITGAAGGIGRSIVKAFLEKGANVVISGTNEEKLKAFESELNSDRVKAVACNLGDADQTNELFAKAEACFGQIDILVNNAGITKDKLLIMMKDEDFENVLEVNLTSCFRLSKAAIKSMLKRNHGRIINVASVVGFSGNPGQTNYVASKAGMVGMSKSMALEVAQKGITVNCVAPGFIASDMTNKLSDKIKNKFWKEYL